MGVQLRAFRVQRDMRPTGWGRAEVQQAGNKEQGTQLDCVAEDGLRQYNNHMMQQHWLPARAAFLPRRLLLGRCGGAPDGP